MINKNQPLNLNSQQQQQLQEKEMRKHWEAKRQEVLKNLDINLNTSFQDTQHRLVTYRENLNVELLNNLVEAERINLASEKLSDQAQDLNSKVQELAIQQQAVARLLALLYTDEKIYEKQGYETLPVNDVCPNFVKPHQPDFENVVQSDKNK